MGHPRPVTRPQIRYYNFNGTPCAHVLELGVFNCAHEPPIKVGTSEILEDWQEISAEMFASLRNRFLTGFHTGIALTVKNLQKQVDHPGELPGQES
jgi:hypothetical protein